MSFFSSAIENLPDLVDGLVVALQLTGISLALGYPIGLALALLTDGRRRVVRGLAVTITELGRGLPLLVLLYIVYQGGPQAGWVPPAMTSAVIAFAFSAAAYSAEIIRSALGAVDDGQRNAAMAVGLSDRDSFRYVIVPQASRIALPPLLSLAIQIFQLSSLAYLVTVPEVMQAARFWGTRSFDYLTAFGTTAALYAAVTIPAAAAVRALEARLSRHL